MQQLCVCEVKLCTHELLTTYGLKGRFVDFQSPCLFSKTLQALKTRTRRNPGPAGTLNQQESWTSRNPGPAGTLDLQEPWTSRNPGPAGILDQQESWTSRKPGSAGTVEQQELWMRRKPDYELSTFALTRRPSSFSLGVLRSSSSSISTPFSRSICTPSVNVNTRLHNTYTSR